MRDLNRWLLAAGLLSLGTSAIHVFSGGPAIMDPVRMAPLSEDVQATLLVVWHAVTVVLVANGVAGVAAAFDRRLRPIVVLGTLQYVGFILLFVAVGLIQFQSVMVMPQWFIFSALAALAVLGLRKPRAAV